MESYRSATIVLQQSAIIINPNVGSGLKQMGFGLLCEWFFTLEDELLREGMNMQSRSFAFSSEKMLTSPNDDESDIYCYHPFSE
ncbi:hypothetical protein RclHR1_06240009 [Rhizophagus clarus]|uniref:Uncharacterized protein n=1 Tax=Rhizophagus clarus TaxID=94130 RepID=A0A2Z6RX63_9GLOM|nr:hypothetical protein RclHR1_06240009 [Rhizophagus clarus]